MKYLDTFQAALDGKLSSWEEEPLGALALVICLDQFPLNMFRNERECFSGESMSLEVATRAINHGYDQNMDKEQTMFLYMPYMHSENMADQDRVLALFSVAGMEGGLKWVNHHRDIVNRFGRFPHRNVILGRESTLEEIAYLNSDDAFTG